MPPGPSIRFTLDQIRRQSASRPPGYYEDVISKGVISGMEVVLSETSIEELRAKYEPDHVGLAELIANFTKAIVKWMAAGLPVVSKPQFDQRLNTCGTCPEWTGLTCLKCGCTGLKHWLATERCPLGKWESNLDPAVRG